MMTMVLEGCYFPHPITDDHPGATFCDCKCIIVAIGRHRDRAVATPVLVDDPCSNKPMHGAAPLCFFLS